ncbi:Dynein Heavy Chain 17, Axonemal, partial [Manis pentadactyla]
SQSGEKVREYRVRDQSPVFAYIEAKSVLDMPSSGQDTCEHAGHLRTHSLAAS